MTEDFLQYMWKMKMIKVLNLRTSNGENLQVISFGTHNTNSGPDFTNAKIKLDDTTWAGNIEIHVNASDWNKHKHTNDKAYSNVILHVVYENDLPENKPEENLMPVLELKELIDKNKFKQYETWMRNERGLPCEKRLREVKPITINSWLEALFFERLEQKLGQVTALLNQTTQHREESFYRLLAKYFGVAVNAEPFEQLASTLPLTVLAKNKNNLFRIEALLLGVAGLLDEEEDEYAKELEKEYSYLSKKYTLRTLNKESWKFARMRPAGFPTQRIAQFAALIHHSKHLYSQLLEIKNIKDIYKLFQYPVSDYWQHHYRFGEETDRKISTPGKDFIDVIILNVIIPFLFLEGKYRDDETLLNRAHAFAEKLKPENNNISRLFEEHGLKATNAAESQALIQLKKQYCDKKRCLECRIGHELLKMI